ncbi:MAG: lipid-A-disaccharide synthase-related protein [Spirochaetota bacterium]
MGSASGDRPLPREHDGSGSHARPNPYPPAGIPAAHLPPPGDPSPPPSALLVSNGYGEDVVAAHIGELLLAETGGTVLGFPTVGDGAFYRSRGVQLAGTGLSLPSMGFVRSPGDLVRDLAAGLIGRTLAMGRSLHAAADRFDYLVVVGDPYLLLFTSLFTRRHRRSMIFVGVQQSEWYQSRKPFKQHYSALERGWLRKRAGLVYVRDEKTMEFLRSRGLVHVRCTGNPMMDCFTIHPHRVLPENRRIIGILPGSKQEAYHNLAVAVEVADLLHRWRDDLLFAVALSPQLDPDRAAGRCGLLRVGQVSGGNGESWEYAQYRTPAGAHLLMSCSLFGDIISSSEAVIGLSGTGNEQAAGLGKPVFGFWGPGPQITRKFLQAQKRLLGPSLFLSPPRPREVAAKMLQVLEDEELLREVARNGKMRMQGRGSIRRMAMELIDYMLAIGGRRRRWREARGRF